MVNSHSNWTKDGEQVRASLLYLPFWHSMAGRPLMRIPSKTYEYIGARKPILAAGPLMRIPSKTYEYIGARKPILAAVDHGDVQCILDASGTGIVCSDMTSDALAVTIDEALKQHMTAGIGIRPNDGFIDCFRWDRLTGRMAEVLDSAIASRCGR